MRPKILQKLDGFEVTFGAFYEVPDMPRVLRLLAFRIEVTPLQHTNPLVVLTVKLYPIVQTLQERLFESSQNLKDLIASSRTLHFLIFQH